MSRCKKCETLHNVINNQHLQCLKYFEKTYKMVNNSLYEIIASHRLLEGLKWLHTIHYEWDAETCSKFAEYGCLDCLKYAHKHGCPWDENTTINAVRGKEFDCLKYAYERGCPINLNHCITLALIVNSYKVFIYLIGLDEKF